MVLVRRFSDPIFLFVSGETDGVGRCLVEAARNSGSDDNITAVVVFLRPVSTIMEEEAQRIAQGQVSAAHLLTVPEAGAESSHNGCNTSIYPLLAR